ncbi:erkA [Symbiodinium sp. KB8]|nr:erkA [Symbiodinium sp. KB8]
MGGKAKPTKHTAKELAQKAGQNGATGGASARGPYGFSFLEIAGEGCHLQSRRGRCWSQGQSRAAGRGAGRYSSFLCQDRQGGSVGHSKYKCNICMQSAPDPPVTQRSLIPFCCPSGPLALRKSMQMHFESKHPKEDTAAGTTWEFALEKCTDLHSGAGGATTQGVAVRGGIKKHHN